MKEKIAWWRDQCAVMLLIATGFGIVLEAIGIEIESRWALVFGVCLFIGGVRGFLGQLAKR